MLRCAVLDDYQGYAAGFVDWTRLAPRVTVEVFQAHFRNEDALVAALQPFHMVVLMRERTPFPASVQSQLPNLKLLITTGMRNGAIDLEAATERGITVCGTRGRLEPTVELTWALLLALARHLPQEIEAFRTGAPWQTTAIGADLQGRQLGVMGLGRVGSKVAAVGSAFGMQVSAWSQNLTAETAAAKAVDFCQSKEELLERSDFLTLHLILSRRTKHIVGASELSLMKSTAFLVNTSRAGLIERSALLHALKEGQIAGAAVDVFETEPLPQEDELRRAPNFLGTPHLGHVTRGNYALYYQDVLEDIETYLNGAPCRLLGGAPA